MNTTKKDFMLYDGNHLFHYTKFESALKIIISKTLKFGSFSNMNDIAEVKREAFGMVPLEKIFQELEKYQSISFTKDTPSRRGYSIDPLWGYYAEKGDGVCLVFNKKKIESKAKEQFGKRLFINPIKYPCNFTNAIFTNGDSEEEIKQFIEEHINDIFFTKSIDWRHEQEYRVLLKNCAQKEYLAFDEDILIAAILCLPKSEDYKATSEYKILKRLLPDTPILHYTTNLGNKELLDENEERVCNIFGKDMQLDI